MIIHRPMRLVSAFLLGLILCLALLANGTLVRAQQGSASGEAKVPTTIGGSASGDDTISGRADGDTTTTPVDAGGGIFKVQKDEFKIPITLPNLVILGETWGTGEDFVERLFTFIIQLLQLVAGLAAFGYFLYGAFTYMTAGGDPSKVDTARKMLIGSVIGMIIVILSYAIVAYMAAEFTGAVKE